LTSKGGEEGEDVRPFVKRGVCVHELSVVCVGQILRRVQVEPTLTGTAGRIGKDDARGRLVSLAKLSASVLE
jgi:hypothetical protein